MAEEFGHPLLRQLALQLRYSPTAQKHKQLERTERFFESLTPGRGYTYSEICEQITGYRPRAADAGVVIDAATLSRELIPLMEQLAAAVVFVASEQTEPVLSIEQAARYFNVSTKTINRWRKKGLIARRFLMADGVVRLGFLQSTVEGFARRNAEAVARAGRFTQLTLVERKRNYALARHLVAAGELSVHEIVRRVAAQGGRAVVTVRYTIKRYDEEHPDAPILPQVFRPLSERDKRLIWRAYKRGVDVGKIAHRLRRTKSSIYRLICERRAVELKRIEIRFIASEEFLRPDADEFILRSQPSDELAEPSARRARRLANPPRDVPSYLRELYRLPLLSPARERDLFRRYNYLKFKAHSLQQQIVPSAARSRQLDELESLLAQAEKVKNEIIQANLRLAVNVAKRHVGAHSSLFELISDANISLMKAVEKFDYTRGFKFSTYATWAIMKNFARSIPESNYRLDRFRTSREEILKAAPDTSQQPSRVAVVEHIREALESVMGKLDERERSIIVDHYGLREDGRRSSLAELGARLGLSKERVRQIEHRALKKLRELLTGVDLEPGL